jgi:hypothetical protein
MTSSNKRLDPILIFDLGSFLIFALHHDRYVPFYVMLCHSNGEHVHGIDVVMKNIEMKYNPHRLCFCFFRLGYNSHSRESPSQYR